ncbi:MAG: DegT/DnrJ/EryC1/StrS family aminotransferase [Planctomycetota bacterium]|nr:MAG: DegT/DnrJ/EryC1/StrS family aminotransferase [Planctomycetota bacterium]REJ92669.1 MAG: DegT/DnrJ/EryC1/StrS family aminotransferase [Planctomycetota bacterium]REK23705.1 MAG: DegT/DnrJ/EryC1/StrS family aminotransferase [Planctomycetota bacterium]REK47559.1 MAG: DegT/DnrJ/EryC1/StrS family aminotransferase [Planctomycetota bacterium]
MKATATSATTSTEPVPLLDLARENGPLEAEIAAAFDAVRRSGSFVLGPEVTRLEEALAQYCGTKHAIGCASGSDALLLALMAIDLAPGDEVIVPSFSFFATASCVWRLGAKIVFVDIDPVTFNLDPAQVAAAITPATRAIVPVHLFGQCADMEAINAIAAQHDITVIEDAAQAIGAELGGRRSGSLGDIGCFSFYPTKNLGGMGDGGMLTTSDDALADKLRLLRGHGMRPRYYHQVVGINSRLDSLQAAVLNVKLPHLDDWTRQRGENAVRYAELFAAAGLPADMVLPVDIAAGSAGRHVWNQYTVRVGGGQRDALRAHLRGESIGSEIYYPVPLHRQACFASVATAGGSLSITEQAAEEVLSLPIFPGLELTEQQRVVAAIGDFFASSQTERAA